MVCAHFAEALFGLFAGAVKCTLKTRESPAMIVSRIERALAGKLLLSSLLLL